MDWVAIKPNNVTALGTQCVYNDAGPSMFSTSNRLEAMQHPACLPPNCKPGIFNPQSEVGRQREGTLQGFSFGGGQPEMVDF